MNANRPKKQNLTFFWYAISIKNTNMDTLIQDIKALQTNRIARIVNLSEIFEQAKVKIRVIFIYAALTQKLKNALLEITGIRHFMPKNSAPYIFCDIEDFLKYHFDKKEIPDIKNKYLHKHEINDPTSIIHSKTNVNQAQKSKESLMAKYQIGDMVLIKSGVFHDHIGIIRDIEDNLLNVDVQVGNSKTNITTSMRFSDTELIKHDNK